VTLLADASKYGRTSMVRIAPLSALKRIITNPPIPAVEQRKLEELRIELVMVEDGRARRGGELRDLEKEARAL
jgi:DeoR/GlpR family transcriptional regulator of sugar metabolism